MRKFRRRKIHKPSVIAVNHGTLIHFSFCIGGLGGVFRGQEQARGKVFQPQSFLQQNAVQNGSYEATA
jgi:hypothetical protein